MNTRPTSSKVLLVAGGRTTSEGAPAVPVRRYRLARILPEYRSTFRKPTPNRSA